MIIGYDSATILQVSCSLIAVGFAYNIIIAWLERNGYDEGYVALEVVVGVLFTLGGIACIDLNAAILALGAFSCSGLFMILGSWYRHVAKRKREQRLLIERLTNDGR